jgi:hypothetical protein
VAQVRRARAAKPWRTVRFTRSIKAVFNRPEKPNPCKAARISVLCSKPHHMGHPHQLAPSVAFFHLAINQLCCHLPLRHVPSSTNHLEPLSEMSREGIEVEIEAITGEEGDATRSQELSQ